MQNRHVIAALAAAIGASAPRKIITRGVMDMTLPGMPVIEEESYLYTGPMALCDEGDDAKVKAIELKLETHYKKVDETLKAYEKQLKEKESSLDDGIKQTIAKLNKEGGQLVADLKEAQVEQKNLIVDLQQKLTTLEKEAKAPKLPGRQKSVGELFIESPELKDFIGANGIASTPIRGSSRPMMLKTITSLPGSAGPGIFPEYLPTPVIPPSQPLTIRDLCQQGTTDKPSIIWLQENVFTNNAGYQSSEGALKPQSDITYTQQTINVATLAHWFKASKQVLADFPLLRTLIDGRGMFGLKLVEEREILFGDGNTNHLHGLVPQATPYNVGLTKGTDTMLDVLRHAMLQVTLAFYPSTGIAISPKDWHDIELLKDGFHRYLFSNPAGSIPAMVWGLPVAQCFSFGAGEFLVGAFKLAATILDREEANVLVSTEDQDNFVRNLVTVLFEERLALAVSRPKAIISGDFAAGTSGPTG